MFPRKRLMGLLKVAEEELLKAFEEPDEDVPEEDLEALEEAFELGEVSCAGTITLPNGRTYRCLAVGWKRFEKGE